MKIKDLPSLGDDPTDAQLQELMLAAARDAQSRAAAADAALRASVAFEVDRVKDRYGLRPGALRAPVLDDERRDAQSHDSNSKSQE